MRDSCPTSQPTRSRSHGGSTISEPELPEGWPDAFDEEARDYLYEEAGVALREITEFAGQQQDKALGLLRLSFVLIAVGGIFGDLQFEQSALGVLSVLAIACSAGVGAIGLWLLFPRNWRTGADMGWLARWQGATTRDMRDAVLESSVQAIQDNTRLSTKRGMLLTALVVALALQTVFVVLVQVASAIE